MDIETFQRLGLHRPFEVLTVNGRSNMEILDALMRPEDSQYNPCAEAYPQPDAPRGTIKAQDDWRGTQIFPDTQRDIRIYIPAQLADFPGDPPVIVFNDGDGYSDHTGAVRAPAVLDTLIDAGEIPPTIGVFVTPRKRRTS